MRIETVNAIRMTLDERYTLDNALELITSFAKLYTKGILAEPTDPKDLTLNDIYEILENNDYLTII